MFTLWDRVRQLEGETIFTLRDGNPFAVVAVLDDCLRVLPEKGNGKERSIRRDRIEHIAALGLLRYELRRRTQQEFPDSRNTSYIAAIVFEVTKRGS